MNRNIFVILTLVLLFEKSVVLSQSQTNSTPYCKYYMEYDNGKTENFIPIIFCIDNRIPIHGNVEILLPDSFTEGRISGYYNVGQVLFSDSDYKKLFFWGDSIRITLIFKYGPLREKNRYEWNLFSSYLFSSVSPYFFHVKNFRGNGKMYKTEIHHANKSNYYIDRKIHHFHLQKKEKDHWR